MAWDVLTVKKKKSLESISSRRTPDIKDIKTFEPLPPDVDKSTSDSSIPFPKKTPSRVRVDQNARGEVDTQASESATSKGGFMNLFSRKRAKSMGQKEPENIPFEMPQIQQLPRLPEHMKPITITVGRPPAVSSSGISKSANPSSLKNPSKLNTTQTEKEPVQNANVVFKHKRIPPPRPRRSTYDGAENPPMMGTLSKSNDKENRPPWTADGHVLSSRPNPPINTNIEVGILTNLRISRLLDNDHFFGKEGLHDGEADRKWKAMLAEMAGDDPFSGQPRVSRSLKSDGGTPNVLSTTSSFLTDFPSGGQASPRVVGNHVGKDRQNSIESYQNRNPQLGHEAPKTRRHWRYDTSQTSTTTTSHDSTPSRTLVEDTPPILPTVSPTKSNRLDGNILAQFDDLNTVIKQMESKGPTELVAPTGRNSTTSQISHIHEEYIHGQSLDYDQQKQNYPGLRSYTSADEIKRLEGMYRRVDELESELQILRAHLATYELQRRHSILHRRQQQYAPFPTEISNEYQRVYNRSNNVEPYFSEPYRYPSMHVLTRRFRNMVKYMAYRPGPKLPYLTRESLLRNLIAARPVHMGTEDTSDEHVYLANLQTYMRGKLVRSKLAIHCASHLAASRIQSCWRAYCERRYPYPLQPTQIQPDSIPRILYTDNGMELPDTNLNKSKPRSELNMLGTESGNEWRENIESDLHKLMQQWQLNDGDPEIRDTLNAFVWLNTETFDGRRTIGSPGASPRNSKIPNDRDALNGRKTRPRAISNVKRSSIRDAMSYMENARSNTSPPPALRVNSRASANTIDNEFGSSPILSSPIDAAVSIFSKRPPPPGPLPAYPPPRVNEMRKSGEIGRGSPNYYSYSDSLSESFYSLPSRNVSNSRVNGMESSRETPLDPTEKRQRSRSAYSTINSVNSDVRRSRTPSSPSSQSYFDDDFDSINSDIFSGSKVGTLAPRLPSAIRQSRGDLLEALGLYASEDRDDISYLKLPSFVSTESTESQSDTDEIIPSSKDNRGEPEKDYDYVLRSAKAA